MKLSAHQYAKTLFETLQDTADKDHDTILQNFAQVLAENNDLKMFENIAEELEKLQKASKGIKIATVTSAHPLDASTEKKIIEQLNQIANSKVEIKKEVDERILGGIVIEMDDTLIDASVKKSLSELKHDLSE
jgi:F-type H+-transporting ATPase subunit delta